MNEFDAPDTSDSSTPRQSSFCVLSTSAQPSMIDFTSSVWFGLVWFGLVWFGLVWFGLVWFVCSHCG
jgi:hypothetical protein